MNKDFLVRIRGDIGELLAELEDAVASSQTVHGSRSFCLLVFASFAAILIVLCSPKESLLEEFLYILFFLIILVDNAIYLIQSHYSHRTIRFNVNRWIESLQEDDSWIGVKMARVYSKTGDEEVPILLLRKGDVIEYESIPFGSQTTPATTFVGGHDHLHKLVILQESVIVTKIKMLLERDASLGSIENRIQKITLRVQNCILPTVVFVSFLISLATHHFGDSRNLDIKYEVIRSLCALIPILYTRLPLILAMQTISDNYLFRGHFTYVYFWLTNKLHMLCGITRVVAVDKEVVSSSQPLVDKLFFFSSDSDGETKAETLLVSSEVDEGTKQWQLSFDHFDWYRYFSSISPLTYLHSFSCLRSYPFSSTCLCSLSRLPNLACETELRKVQEIVINGDFGRLRKRKEQDSHIVLSTLLQRSSASDYQFFSQGSPSTVLQMCTHIWDGVNVRSMDEDMKSITVDFATRNSFTGHCIALCYRHTSSPFICTTSLHEVLPMGLKSTQSVFRKACSVVQLEERTDEFTDNNIFLGLISLQEQAIPSLVDTIESLHEECVRFVFFSRDNQLKSRIVAEKLGLEAGWNCHITLKNEKHVEESSMLSRVISSSQSLPNIEQIHSSSSSLFEHPANKARLPTGIREIRPHLRNVDNVPLLVSIFTDADYSSIKEMLEIMKEEGERVLVLASIDDLSNWNLLCQGQYSIGVTTHLKTACALDDEGTNSQLTRSFMRLSTDFCTNTSQLPCLPSLLSLSRRRFSLFHSSISFFFLSSFFISLLTLPSFFINTSSLPQVIYLLLVQLFITLSISLHDDLVPRLPLPYSPLLSSPLQDFICYFLSHFLSLMIIYFLLLSSSDMTSFITSPFSIQSDLPVAQISSVTFFLSVISLVISSSPFVFPCSLSYSNPAVFNIKWSLVSLFSLFIAYTYCHIQLSASPFLSIKVPILFSYIILLLFSSLLAELYKNSKVKAFKKATLRTKLRFDTKLGMNSPY